MLLVVRVLAVLLVALAALPIAEGAPSTVAKKKFKTVTRNFSDNGQIAILDNANANPFPTTISVGGFKKAKITDVNVVIKGLSHDFASFDVDVLLVAGNGRNAMVMSDVGGPGAVAGLTIRLDDEAETAVQYLTALASGSFQPNNASDTDGNDLFGAPAPVPSGNAALSVFDGGDPNGTWKLFVRDDAAGFDGDIVGGWEIEITAKIKKKKS
jgi:hypothetical protein